MLRRVAAGILEAVKGFRRLKGYAVADAGPCSARARPPARTRHGGRRSSGRVVVTRAAVEFQQPTGHPLIVLKMAYLATGLTLCLVGKRLIDRKRQTTFQGTGSVAKTTSFKLMTTSPGLVFLVAGFVVIAAAIFQKTNISESSRSGTQVVQPTVGPVAQKSGDTRPTPGPTTTLQPLVERVRSVSFIAGTQSQVDTHLERARVLAADGRVDDAAVHLSVAVVIEPATLKEIVNDPAYAPILQQPQFNAIVQARFQLPLSTVDVPSGISAAAEEMIAQLRILARRSVNDNATSQARTVVTSLPARAGQEPERTPLGPYLLFWNSRLRFY